MFKDSTHKNHTNNNQFKENLKQYHHINARADGGAHVFIGTG